MAIKDEYKSKSKMSLKTILNYSPNFKSAKREIKQIKFIIFHYTGMKKESSALKRLTNIQSQVSSHYFVKRNGDIVTLVPDSYIAWHAGISSWKKFKFLNKNSIGIEISNPGHDFSYKKFSTKQINSILKLSKFLIKKYKIYSRNILGHSDIAPNRKKDPGEKFPWKFLAKNNIGVWHEISQDILKKNRKHEANIVSKKRFYNNLFKIGYLKISLKDKTQKGHLKLLVKAFQRRFRPEIVNGKIDKECVLISENLIKKFN